MLGISDEYEIFIANSKSLYLGLERVSQKISSLFDSDSKVEERIKDAKIRIMGVIIIALTIVCLYMIQDFFRVAKPIKPDRIN